MSGAAMPGVTLTARTLYWSVRRELWENRAIVIAPLVVAVLMLVAFLIRLAHVPGVAMSVTVNGAAPHMDITVPFAVAAFLILGTSVVVGVFYCLDALYGERRDRSILFWKSLPVSDLVALLGKIAIPMLVLPVIAIVMILSVQLVMLVASLLAARIGGGSAAAVWAQLPVMRMTTGLFYGVAAQSLWYAPIYGWLLLVSGLAKRAVFLWAVLPPLVLCLVERIALESGHLWHLLVYRFVGFFKAAFVPAGDGSGVDLPAPLHLLGTPGLWAGLAVAAGLLAGCVWLRRNHTPL